MFYVGQKVVCVNDGKLDHHSGHWTHDIPVKGCIYTVVGSTKFNDPCMGINVCLILKEIKNSPWFKGAYLADRFRPLTDISIFTAMLNRAPTPEQETV